MLQYNSAIRNALILCMVCYCVRGFEDDNRGFLVVKSFFRLGSINLNKSGYCADLFQVGADADVEAV